MNYTFAGLLAACLAVPAFGQGPSASPVVAPVAAVEAQQPLVVGGTSPSHLSQGTEFSVRLLRELTTKDKALHVGDRFDLETVDPIKLGSVTVFPSGTRAVGEITFVRNKGMWGKSGKLQARLLFLRLGDRNFRITGQFDDKGASGGWGAGLTSAIVFLPAGFVMTGKSAVVPAGAVIRASLDEIVPIVIAPIAPQPVIITAPTATVAPAPVPAPAPVTK